MKGRFTLENGSTVSSPTQLLVNTSFIKLKLHLKKILCLGATNVGTIRVYFDKSLQTNRPKAHYQKDKCLGSGISLKKGEPIGEFRMGSTIVLVFEAPSDFHFHLKCGQKLKMGQSIGRIKHESSTNKLQADRRVKA